MASVSKAVIHIESPAGGWVSGLLWINRAAGRVQFFALPKMYELNTRCPRLGMGIGQGWGAMAGGNADERLAAGAAVLKTLYQLVGEPSYTRLIERCQLRGTPLSKATITNLLVGSGSPRPRTVRTFIHACMELKTRTVVWPQGRHTAQTWIDAYDTACGRIPTTTTSATETRAHLVRVGMRPRPADALQPRGQLIELLGSVIDEGKTAVLTQSVSQPARVLSGLGGVGKSQLAAHYAGQQWHDPAIDVIVWANATSTSGIVEAYAEAATHLVGSGSDAEQDARRFLRWVATTPKRWLIVLDDLMSPGDLGPWWPPVTATGQTVITTRYRGNAFDRGDVELIPVDVFTAAESRAYLNQRLTNHPHLLLGPDIDAQLDGLAADLGGLPLALAQATAYMINEATPVDTYRVLVTDQRRRLDDVVPDRDELPDGHQATITATWSLSIQRANTTAPKGVAWPLLQIAALLDPTGIPEAMFTADAVTNYLTGALDLDPPLDPHTVRRGLALLHRYNLLTLEATRLDHTITIHGLVQRATREAMPETTETDPPLLTIDRADLTYAVADALYDTWAQIDTTSGIGAIWRANTTALTTHAGQYLWDPKIHVVLFRLGQSLGEAGMVTRAVDYFNALRSTAMKHLGSKHPDTLRALNDLATWRGFRGDVSGAGADFKKLLAEVVPLLGPEHPN